MNEAVEVDYDAVILKLSIVHIKTSVTGHQLEWAEEEVA